MSASPRVLYFGCRSSRPGDGGHFLYEPGWWSVRSFKAFDYQMLDGMYAPGGERLRRWKSFEQVEGHAAWHVVNGWTVVSFWDRSGDARGNSNSAFVVEGEHSFEHVLELAREVWPEVFTRFTFDITTTPKALA